MANTYTQLYVHCVFAVKYRAAKLQAQWDSRLRSYITAVVQNNKHKMLAIYNMPDHLHLVVGLNPNQSILDMMHVVKGESSQWINKEGLTKRMFQWQEGFGAFSYAKSQVPAVIRYIQNQEAHHKKECFLDEYRRMLQVFEIEYDEQYIFKEPV